MISVYYPYDFEAHKNLSHKQLWLTVYYFMDYAVACQTTINVSLEKSLGKFLWQILSWKNSKLDRSSVEKIVQVDPFGLRNLTFLTVQVLKLRSGNFRKLTIRLHPEKLTLLTKRYFWIFFRNRAGWWWPSDGPKNVATVIFATL